MNNNQILLVELLSKAIRNEKFNLEHDKNINWDEIFLEAEAHQVHTLIYPIVKFINNEGLINKDLMHKWKSSTCINGINQVQHVQKVKSILEEFNKRNIPVIILKGLIIRNLYPHPELRIMGDADILVNKSDIEHCKNILVNMGYIEVTSNFMHLHFENNSHHSVELHWRLTNSDNIKNSDDFERRIWQNACNVEVFGTPSLSLSPCDQVMHACIHIVEHFIACGFGLRQLCDLTLLVEAYIDKIEWNSFFLTADLYGISKFVNALFVICNELFEMKTPFDYNSKDIKNTSYINLLTNDIISSGIFGGNHLYGELGSYVAHHEDKKNSPHSFNRFKNSLSLAFPSVHKMKAKYPYVKKCILLLPIAWLHRLLYNDIFKNYSIIKKLSFSFSIISKSRKRARLLRWLELQ